MSNNRKAQGDYDRQVICNDCGSETGPFYRDTDDNDVLCMDCVLGLQTQEQIDFDAAVENAVNLTVDERNGWAWITCAHCGADIDQFNLDDGGSSIEDATALLEADEEHDCQEDEEEALV